MDLTNRTCFFEFTTAPNVIWTELQKFDLAGGSPVMLLDPDNISLSGDVTSQFEPGKVIYSGDVKGGPSAYAAKIGSGRPRKRVSIAKRAPPL